MTASLLTPNDLDASTPFPIISVGGTPREMGLQHGQKAKKQVLGSIAAYKSIFFDLAGLQWETVLEKAKQFDAPLRAAHPDLVEEMEGVAEGAGVDYMVILALNTRSEISLAEPRAEPFDGCTSLSRISSDGSVYIAQNWDWKTKIAGGIIILDGKPKGFPAFKMTTEAGIIGKMGHNSEGVFLVMNAIKAKSLDYNLLPIHLLMRRILQQTSAAAVRKYVDGLSGSAASVHLMVADRHDAFTIEISPNGFEYIERDENSALYHSNHFISPTMHKKSKEVDLWLADSPIRLAKIRETLAVTSELSHSKIRELLSDRSNGHCSICRHEGGDGIDTLFTLSMSSNGTAEVKRGKPDENGVVMNIAF